MSKRREYPDGLARRSSRFTAPDEIVLVLGKMRVLLVDVSDTGMRVAVPEGVEFKPENSYEFRLVVRDAGKVTGWHLVAICMWADERLAGFRFLAEAGFSRELFGGLLRLLSAGRARVVNGTEL